MRCDVCGRSLNIFAGVQWNSHSDEYHAMIGKMRRYAIRDHIYQLIAKRTGHDVSLWTDIYHVRYSCACGWQGSWSFEEDSKHTAMRHMVHAGQLAAAKILIDRRK